MYLTRLSHVNFRDQSSLEHIGYLAYTQRQMLSIISKFLINYQTWIYFVFFSTNWKQFAYKKLGFIVLAQSCSRSTRRAYNSPSPKFDFVILLFWFTIMLMKPNLFLTLNIFLINFCTSFIIVFIQQNSANHLTWICIYVLEKFREY